MSLFSVDLSMLDFQIIYLLFGDLIRPKKLLL